MLETKFRADQHPSLYRNSSWIIFCSKDHAMKRRGRKGGRQRGSLEGRGRNQLFELCQCQNLWGVGWCICSMPITDHLTEQWGIDTLREKLALNLPTEGGNRVAAVTQSFSFWSPGSHSSMILVSIGIKLCREKTWVTWSVHTGWIPLESCKLVRILTCLCATSFQTFRLTESANSPSFFPVFNTCFLCVHYLFSRGLHFLSWRYKGNATVKRLIFYS